MLFVTVIIMNVLASFTIIIVLFRFFIVFYFMYKKQQLLTRIHAVNLAKYKYLAKSN